MQESLLRIHLCARRSRRICIAAPLPILAYSEGDAPDSHAAREWRRLMAGFSRGRKAADNAEDFNLGGRGHRAPRRKHAFSPRPVRLKV
jgi:hypothetical protein